MRPPLDGTVLVTGASSGIGRELARELGRASRVMILVARRGDRLGALASELTRRGTPRVIVRAANLLDTEALPRVLDEVIGEAGPIDVLVNAAGMGDEGLFELAPWDKTEEMMRLNMVAPTLLARRLLPGMIERGRGGVLNVSSGFGLNFMPGFAAYVGTKHYLTAFTESLRSEVAGTGVVVSQVCPGPVETEFDAISREPTGVTVPGCPSWLTMSAEACAREAVRGFAKGRALIVPGWKMQLVSSLEAFAPRVVHRFFQAPMGKRLRTLQERLARMDGRL